MDSKLISVAAALIMVGVTLVLGNPEIIQAGESVGHAHHGHHPQGWGWGQGHNHGWGQDYYAEPKYAYAYGVNDHYTGDAKQVTEQRHKGWTRGSYSVVQPDGIVRTVKYEADPWNGFQAVVHNKGWAQHPVTYSHHTGKQYHESHVPIVPVKDQH